MASGLFPEEAKECSDFMRHKDILISPNLLRTNNISFTQVCEYVCNCVCACVCV